MQTVVPDTNILVSGLCFPESMGHEIIQMARSEEQLFLLPEYILLETRTVLSRDFPEHADQLTKYRSEFTIRTGLPKRKTVQTSMDLIDDPKDAPVLASVIEHRPDHFISGDTGDFHTDQVKSHLQDHGITIHTPYGYLKEKNKR